jgi:hypothetical protein
VDNVSQTGGNNNCTEVFLEAFVTTVGLGTKTTSKIQTEGEESPLQNLAKILENIQELTSNTSAKRHTNQTVHRGKSHRDLTSVRPVKSTHQTG